MKKRITGILAACAVTLFAGSAFAYPATVTNDLNLRSGPSTATRVIGTMPQGTVVDVIDCRGSWCEVEWRGRVGYASRNFLAERVERRQPTPPPSAVIPFPGFGIEIRPGGPQIAPDRGPPRRESRRSCNERRAEWAIGERARDSTVDSAADAAGARLVRVVRPGDFVTQEIRRDRLTVEVDRRNRIVDVACR
jgi:hypothetical protein